MGQVIPFDPRRPADAACAPELNLAEKAFLQSVRCWVIAFRKDQDPVLYLYDELPFPMALDATIAIHDFMMIVARTVSQPIAIHGPGCQCLSDDELRLLDAAGLVQAGEYVRAERALRASLSEVGAEFALRPLGGLGEVFAQGGLLFKSRMPPAGGATVRPINVWSPRSAHGRMLVRRAEEVVS